MRLRLIHLCWLLVLTMVVGCSETPAPAPAADTATPGATADAGTAKGAPKAGKKAPKTLEKMQGGAPSFDGPMPSR